MHRSPDCETGVMTRKIYFDELPRITRSHREFAAAVAARGR
jgi:hypothetical protein